MAEQSAALVGTAMALQTGCWPTTSNRACTIWKNHLARYSMRLMDTLPTKQQDGCGRILAALLFKSASHSPVIFMEFRLRSRPPPALAHRMAGLSRQHAGLWLTAGSELHIKAIVSPSVKMFSGPCTARRMPRATSTRQVGMTACGIAFVLYLTGRVQRLAGQTWRMKREARCLSAHQ